MQSLGPVIRNSTGRARHGLFLWMVVWWRQLRTGGVLVGLEVPEPVLVRFKAPHVAVTRVFPVPASVLTWR